MNAIEIALEQAMRTRGRFIRRDIRNRSTMQEQLHAGGAEFVSYDADRGITRAKLADGKVIEGDFISTSGVAPGDRMAFTRSSSGVFFKVMPR